MKYYPYPICIQKICAESCKIYFPSDTFPVFVNFDVLCCSFSWWGIYGYRYFLVYKLLQHPSFYNQTLLLVEYVISGHEFSNNWLVAINFSCNQCMLKITLWKMLTSCWLRTNEAKNTVTFKKTMKIVTLLDFFQIIVISIVL